VGRLKLNIIFSTVGLLMAAMPASSALVQWQCSVAGTEASKLVTLDEDNAQVVWEIKSSENRWEFTETASFSADWVEWSFLLPATTVTMYHRLDQRSGELSVTQGDSGKVRRWLCTVVPEASSS
tara:strand:+ start:168 stop:539 length:372 start_codon:yes stop_codon:yes gene_type:complete